MTMTLKCELMLQKDDGDGSKTRTALAKREDLVNPDKLCNRYQNPIKPKEERKCIKRNGIKRKGELIKYFGRLL